jgi:hypothetical protein
MSALSAALVYTVEFDNVPITAAAQDIVTIAAAAGVPVKIVSWRLEFVPTITSGVPQDVRVQLRSLLRTTAGSGGTAITPAPVNSRLTTAAAGTYTRTVTTPGTAGTVQRAYQPSIIVPFERVFTEDQMPFIAAGTTWALNLETAPGSAYNASLELIVAEF